MPSMRALVTAAGGTAQVSKVEIPVLQHGEVLVKVRAVAQNPTDWKTMKASQPGRIVGADFCGTVEEANGTHWRKDQRVAGFVHGSSVDPQRGAFAEYVVTEEDMLYPVPESITDEEAAAICLALSTAIQALFQRLALPEPTSPSKSATPVLINGGTSSVGKYSIQLCRLAGLTVIATGSKRNHELLTKLGAHHCIDYKDDDWPSQVRSLTDDALKHGFDCVSETATTESMSRAMSTSGGHIVTLLPIKDASIPSGVRVESTNVHTVFGRPLQKAGFENVNPVKAEDKEIWVKYLHLVPELLASQKLRPNRIKSMDGGLDGILAGFQLQIDGKVSAEKLCYTI